jgi:hypothetical protein
MTLCYGLTPKQRGLVEEDGLPMYTFSPDFVNRLWTAIEKVDAEFAEDYECFQAQPAVQASTAGEK